MAYRDEGLSANEFMGTCEIGQLHPLPIAEGARVNWAGIGT
jgi:hypothetical protein